MASRTRKLRRPDVCVVCGSSLSAGTEAWWDPAVRTVTCVTCKSSTASYPPVETQPEVDRGVAGASAAREHQRRKTNREARTRQAHPRIGGLLLALRDPPQHESGFERGKQGEEAVAAGLEKRIADGPAMILNDRRMPGGRGNIDLLAVAPAGVFVIDAKAHKSKVQVVNSLLGRSKLLIAGRAQTNLIDGLDRQVAAVRDARAAAQRSAVAFQGVLCFTTADLPLLGTLKMRGHLLLYRNALAKRLHADGPLTCPRSTHSP